MTALVDVSDINPGRLLAELFNAATEDVNAETQYNVADSMAQVGAQTMLAKTNFVEKGAYFRTIRGRFLEVTITGWKIHPFRYDQRYGAGSVQTIVDNIRANP